MKQKLFKLALLFTAVLAFSACSNDDNSPIIEPITVTTMPMW